MRFQAFYAAAVSLSLSTSLVNAHGYVSQIYINEKGYLGWYQDGPSLLNIQGIGNIRDIGTPQLPAHNPTQGPTNLPPGSFRGAMASGGDGTEDNRGKEIKEISAAAKGGDTVTLWMENWPTGHMGGSWNMMARCGGSCIGKKPENLSWLKISEDNYDPQSKEWPLAIPGPQLGIARRFTLPTKLPGGEYLLSCTLLALHSAASTPAPQFYPTAWRIMLADSGVKTMPSFGSDEIGNIPGMYTKMRNDATTFNINRPDLSPPEKFVLPGVKVWTDSDSDVKDAQDFVPKPIGGTVAPAVARAVKRANRSPPSDQQGEPVSPVKARGQEDRAMKCGDDFTKCLEHGKGDNAKITACSVAHLECVAAKPASLTLGRRGFGPQRMV